MKLLMEDSLFEEIFDRLDAARLKPDVADTCSRPATATKRGQASWLGSSAALILQDGSSDAVLVPGEC